MKKLMEEKVVITPAAAINFKSKEVKRALTKIKVQNKAISEQSKIDRKKLSLCISI